MPDDQSQHLWSAVDDYFNAALLPHDPVLEAALRASADAGLPPIQVAPNQGKLLMLLARLMNAARVLEIGTLAGYSTIWLARGLAPGGRITTLEIDPKHAEVARGNFARAGLADIVSLRVGPALDTLPKLAAEHAGPFDLVFIDADKPSNPHYFAWALKFARPGSVIVIDNVVREGAVLDAASTDGSVRGVRTLIEMIRAEPRVTASALQTVGGKGYDGFVLARVHDAPTAGRDDPRRGCAANMSPSDEPGPARAGILKIGDHMNAIGRASVVVLGSVAGVIASCGSPVRTQAEPSPSVTADVSRIDMPAITETAPRDFAGLHNVVTFHDGFVSGSAPEGEAGFDTLRAMGVRTIISVDGAEPEVEHARARGMRYIHLPIGYNGFDETRKLELVRATRDAVRDGPVYIHCHHGKHRSAGAAAVIAASLGWTTPAEGVARMKVSGTAPSYRGLFACASAAAVLTTAEIDAVPATFPEVARPGGFVKGMVEIDAAFDHLTLIEKAGWRPPADHPDLVPAGESGRLADLFRVLNRGAYVQRHPPDFSALMSEAMDHAQALEVSLADGGIDAATLSARFGFLAASCKDCHAKYRD